MVGNRRGIPSEINILVRLRLLHSGHSYDNLDDGSRKGDETIRQYFMQFTKDMCRFYGKKYPNRRPTREELQRVMDGYKDAGFPGCAGCLKCMKVVWKKYPLAEKGQYHNKKESKMVTVVEEGWCDRSLYIWSCLTGRAGTNNDLNVLSVSLFHTGYYEWPVPLQA